MELAITLIALGGMFVISNQNKSESSEKQIYTEGFKGKGLKGKQGFTNMGKDKNYLPNVNVPPQNYPITNNKELIDTVQQYPNPNTATDKYFNQNLFEQRANAKKDVGNTIQEVYSLTGDYLSSKEFKHNNMVPFNGGKPKGQIYNNNNAETILDNYAGNGSQLIKKIEQAPLFKPQENIQWAYGAPNMSDFYQSRVNPAQKNSMVKPFESVQVGPGLNKGFSSDGSGGFNSGMESRDQWLPKTVDELRVSTNPKEEYSLLNHQGPARSNITNVGILGKVEKNRPDTFFINSQDRWLTTTGAEKAQRQVADEVFKTSNRNETTTQIMGTPNATLKTASYTPTIAEPSKRIQLDGYNAGPSASIGAGPHTDTDKYLKSHTNYNNNRSINNQPQTFGSGFSSAIGAVVAPLMDIFKPVRKEEYGDNIRVYGNAAGEVTGNYVQTCGDVPNVTVKETTIYQPNGYIGNQLNGAYEVNTQRPIANQRDTTGSIKHTNPMGSKYGNRQYDADYSQTNNESKQKLVAARINQGNAKMFNTSQNNVSMSKLDSDRDNNRLWAPQSIIQNGPSVKTYGKIVTGPQLHDSNIGVQRMEPGLLQAFIDNPYTHSLSSAPATHL
jgi:hypothetical protein